MSPGDPRMGKKRHSNTKKRSARKRQPRRRHNAPGRRVPSSVLGRLQRQWPFHEVLVNENWRSSGGLTQLVVSRRAEESGDIVAGVFLVDLGCLGLKNGFLSFLDPGEFGQLVGGLRETQPMVACEPDLAAKIVLTGLEYADNLGFKPHPDAVEAFPVLLGAHASACDELVPLGDGKGKPLYISGPHDNVKRVLATLDRTVGPGGYEFIVAGTDGDALSGEAIEDHDGFEDACFEETTDPG